MKKGKFWVLSLCFGLGIITYPALAQSNIGQLRYEDNFTYLKDDTLKTGLNRLKYISWGYGNYISLGGELREQFQIFKNINFGDIPPNYPEVSPNQLNHRFMIHADLEFGKHVRLFTQVNNTLRFLNKNPSAPEIDENRLSLHQAFVLLALKDLRIHIGRQELFYGSHHLITVREGTNSRKNFDGIVMQKKLKNGRIDILALSPIISRPHAFDDISFKEWMIGIYGTTILSEKKLGVDYFGVNFKSGLRKYNYVSGNENRFTYGVRFFSNLKRINFEAEAIYQTGKFGNLRIDAYSLMADINVLLLPQQRGVLGISASIASGDKNNDDSRLNTYNLLFAKPAYGLAMPIGATNMVSVYPYIKINPSPKFNLLAQVFFLKRKSTHDGTYSPGMIENRPSPELLFNSNKKGLGMLYDFEANFQQTQNMAFAFDLSWVKPGDYSISTGKGKNTTYISFKSTFKF